MTDWDAIEKHVKDAGNAAHKEFALAQIQTAHNQDQRQAELIDAVRALKSSIEKPLAQQVGGLDASLSSVHNDLDSLKTAIDGFNKSTTILYIVMIVLTLALVVVGAKQAHLF